MTQALYRKYRPQQWDAVVGQDHVVTTLKNAIAADRVAHAYLFAGSRGTGKTTLARLLAKAVNCTNPDPTQRPDNECGNCKAVNDNRFLDLIEIDAASNTSVDDVRDLRDKINFTPSQGIYKVYVIDECFRYEDTVTLADGSKLPIGKIVSEKLPVEVLSYNEKNGQIEAKPIVRWMSKPPITPTIRVTFDNNRAVVCTINHRFYTPSGVRLAGDLEVGDFVYSAYERITQHQLSVVVGAAIGDGHISLTGSQMRARLSITQGADQKIYLKYKAQLLGDLVQSPLAFQNYPGTFSRKGTFRLATRSFPQIAEIHRELYDGNGQKRVSREYLERLTPLGLALWYLDDGSLVTQDHKYTRKKDGGISHYPATRSTLSVHGLALEEARTIVDWLEEIWGVNGGVTETTKGPVIWFTLEGTRKLHEIIAEYVPPEMDYKLLPQFHGRFVYPQDDESLAGLAVSVVRDIEEVDPPDYVYNIEVADNHNYFVRDILVANCHMLSVAAFNALLKTLEEPPPHAIFVLATTEIHKIPATILSRCQRHEFRRVPVDEIVANLKKIVKAENLQADDDALIQIARQSAGGMRDAQSLLDQLSSTGDRITLALAQTVLGTATSQTVLDIITAIWDHDPARGLESIHRALDAGADPRSLARQLVEYLRGLMLIQMGNANQVEATADVKKQMQSHAKSFTTSDVLRMMKSFNNAATDLRGGWQPSLSLELALAEVLDAPNETTPAPAAPSSPGRTRQTTPKPATASPSSPQPKGVGGGSRPQAESTASPKAHRDDMSGSEGAVEVASHPAEKPALNTGDVIKAWKQMSVSLPKAQANLSALMNSVRMIDVQGKTLILGLASDVLVSKIDKPDQIEVIQKLIKGEFGVDVNIRCMVTTAKGKIPPNVAQDGMVAAAIQHGGEIVDMQD
jgi:DNA polymerase-3 subunit gamma/tau